MEVNRCNGTRRNKNKQIVEKNVRAQNFVTAIVAPYSHNIKLFSICLFSGRLVCTPNLSHTHCELVCFRLLLFWKSNLNEFEAISTQKIQQSIRSFISMFINH